MIILTEQIEHTSTIYLLTQYHKRIELSWPRRFSIPNFGPSYDSHSKHIDHCDGKEIVQTCDHVELLKTKTNGHGLNSEEEEPHKGKGCMYIQGFLIACHIDSPIVVPSKVLACHVRALKDIRLPKESVNEGSTEGNVTNCARYDNKLSLVLRSLLSGF